MKIIDPSDPTTKEYLARIGEIIVELNFLENWLEFFSWELIQAKGNLQKIGRRITYNLTFIQKLDLLRSLLVERTGEGNAEEFRPLYKKIKECEEIRNDIAHSLWFIQYGNSKEDLNTTKINVSYAFERGRSFDFSKTKKTVPLSELEESGKKIADTSDEVFKYFSILLLSNPLQKESDKEKTSPK